MHEFNDTFEKRFWAKVAKGDHPDSCWQWTAYRSIKGYGQLSASGRPIKMVYVHRASWVLHFGDIPDGKFVLHKCDNPGCVRPDHLELGDHQMNMDQKVARGRASSRKVFTQFEANLLRDAHASGLSKLEISRRTGIDYNTVLHVISKDYEGRLPITMSMLGV